MKVELSIHAINLKNVAGAFKGTSDPFVIVTKVATNEGEKAEVLGKSEVAKNNLNPSFVKVFVLDYTLGQTTKVAITIFDEVRKGDNKSMGSAVFDIAEVLGARGSTQGKKVKGGGTVFVHARKSTGSGVLRLKLKGTKLKNVEGFFSKSDPFYEISKKIDAAGGRTWNNVYRSEDIHNNLNPNWKEAAIEMSILCGGDLDLPLRFAVYDHESSGNHTPMGEFQTSVNGLIQAGNQRQSFKLKNKGKDTGTIEVEKATIDGTQDLSSKMAATTITPSTPAPTTFVPAAPTLQNSDFIDYVTGGCQLNVAVAIDYTGSNGDPRKPGTLHHFNSDGSRNDYEKAIAAIVSILAKYDSDQKFPVYGFGAKYGGVVRHCFQCGSAPEHVGVAGVLSAYKQTFSSGLIMSGPTVFTEVIETVAARAISAQDAAFARGEQCYTVLLIVTDGAVSDIQATSQCLQQVSQAPLSIVIVGVGNADFGGMRFLDDYSGPGKRDIAQFVEFNKCQHSSQLLTSQTLDEIPAQLTGYFKSMGIAANPPTSRADHEVAVGEEEEIDLSLDIREDEIVVTGGGDDFVNGFNASR